MRITDIGTSCGIVYHYTTLAAALSIITEKGLKFHASRYDHMDDAYDSEYGFVSAERTLGEHYCYDNSSCTPYVLSFCKRGDDLSMQRMYNAEVVLQIDSDLLLRDASKKSEKVRGDEIKYLTERETGHQVEDAHKDCNCAAPNLEELEYNAAAISSFYKHEQYAIEGEWRLSYFQDFDPRNGNRMESLLESDQEFCSEVKFKVAHGKVRLYRELTFDKNCLKGIKVFEWTFPAKLRIMDILTTWLAKCKYKHGAVNLCCTDTPMVNK